MFSLYQKLKRYPILLDSTAIGAALLFVSLSVFLTLQLSFTPIPFCFQTHALLFCSVLLGSWRATVCSALLLGLAVLGLPALASGAVGLEGLMGPTGGYLVGYILGSFITGLIAEYGEQTLSKDFLAMLVGNLIIYLFGFAWLTHFIDPRLAFFKGIAPFVPGDCIKLIIFVKLLQKLPATRYTVREKL